MLRQLKLKDMYKMSRILKKMDLKNNVDLGNMFKGEGTTGSQTKLGLELMLLIGENIHLVEDDVNEFLGDLSNKTKDEVENLSLKETKELFAEFKKLDGISDFFSKAGKQTKLKS